MKYIKQEFADFHAKGTPQHYIRPQIEAHIHWKELISRMRYHNQSLSEGEIVTVMEQLEKTVSELLAQGFAVEIGNLGYLSPSLGLKKGKEMDSLEGNDPKRNAQSIKVDGIDVSINRKFVEKVDKMAHIEYGGTVRLRQKVYTKPQRLEKAKEHIRRYGFIRIFDYMNLVNVSHTQAVVELREFANDPETHIARQGRKASLMYVLK